MEKLLNRYDKECMKMAMLKHEETFREQVYELHRLYQIQKLLMNNISKINISTASNKIKINQDLCKRPRECLNSGRASQGTEDESELELTLGPTSHIKRGNFGNYHHHHHHTREELMMGRKWSLEDIPSSSVPVGFLSGRKNSSSDVEEQFRQDRHSSNNNPPWLFQALSHNTS